MKKIAYICAFSNREIQKRLSLKDLSSANRLRTLFGIPALKYVDSASWNTDIISSWDSWMVRLGKYTLFYRRIGIVF